MASFRFVRPLAALLAAAMPALWALLGAVPCHGAEPLKIGVLQIEDVVPLYVARQHGYFRKEGVDVSLVPFLSALERDSALAAGAIDGAINDPIGAILFDQGRGLIQITSLGLGRTPAEGIFAILAAPGSAIYRIDELKGVEIAISSATIIDYVTERLLTDAGLAADEIRTVDVKKMPIRMQMLLSGAVQAATLPEPLASIAAGSGARIVTSDDRAEESLSQTVLVFRTAILTERPEDIASFFRAYRSGVETINGRPEDYRDLVARIGRIPADLAPRYPIPSYPPPQPFPRELYEPVMDWLANRGLVQQLPYETMVATGFLGDSASR